MTAKRSALTEEEESFLRGRAAGLLGRHRIRRAKGVLGAVERNRLFLDVLEGFFERYPFPKAGVYRTPKSKVGDGRILNLMLSDLHYGSDIAAAEAGTQYGPKEEARRTAWVVKTVAEWKRQYRNETELYVHLLGDIIEGKLHDAETAAPLAEQVYRAIWNLSQALQYLASQFKRVSVFAVPGNHGRRKDRHPDRAVNQKWDSIENMIYGALKIGLASTSNITFDIPLTPYYIYRAFDQKGFMTHGDSVLVPGFPNRSINVEAVRRQVNEINTKEHCDLFGVGHVHVASSTRLPSGPVLVTNGCLVPSGEYGQAIGIMNTTSCQQVWESVPGIIYGHRMDILVDETTDRNSALDKIIKPFPGPHVFGRR